MSAYLSINNSYSINNRNPKFMEVNRYIEKLSLNGYHSRKTKAFEIWYLINKVENGIDSVVSFAAVAELVDAQRWGRCEVKTSWKFESSQPHHFMYQIMCNSLICRRLYRLHINGDAQNDVQNLCPAADFFLFKRWKHERWIQCCVKEDILKQYKCE